MDRSRAGPSILFVHNHPARFVQLDLDALRNRYRVTELYQRSRWIRPAALWREVSSHDLVFGWFASWHTLLPLLFARLLGRRSVLVIGGYDVANMPEIGYGHQRGGVAKWASRWTMRLATSLLTNARYSQEEAARTARIPSDRISMAYHGLPDLFGALEAGQRAPVALTVGNVEWPNLWRKGIESFVRAASLLPAVEFVVVGEWRDASIERLKSIAGANVTFTGRVSDEQLGKHYRRASVYVQASAHEGFGMSVAESMLAGCIPVITRAGALPEVVGDAGLYLPSQEPAEIAASIQKALAMPQAARERARQRILDCFPFEQRCESLEQLIDGVLSAAARPARLQASPMESPWSR